MHGPPLHLGLLSIGLAPSPLSRCYTAPWPVRIAPRKLPPRSFSASTMSGSGSICSITSHMVAPPNPRGSSASTNTTSSKLWSCRTRLPPAHRLDTWRTQGQLEGSGPPDRREIRSALHSGSCTAPHRLSGRRHFTLCHAQESARLCAAFHPGTPENLHQRRGPRLSRRYRPARAH